MCVTVLIVGTICSCEVSVFKAHMYNLCLGWGAEFTELWAVNNDLTGKEFAFFFFLERN